MKTTLAIVGLFFVSMLTGLSAITIPAGTAFSLTWDRNPAAQQVTHYTVYELVGGQRLLAHRTTGNEIIAPITPRPLGLHLYVATASNAGGESQASEPPLEIEIVPVVVPVVPGRVAGLTGALTSDNIILTWTARPASENVTGYVVYEDRGVEQLTYTVVSSTLTLVNASPGPHTFQVCAKNAVGEGAKSVAFVITVPPPVPNVPMAPVNFRKVP